MATKVRYSPAQIEAMIRGEVRRQGGDPNGPVANLLVATGTQESGLNHVAVGDNGDSIGVFQFNKNGAGAGKSRAWLQNPMNQIRNRVRLFLDANATTGAQAAAIQRPADPSGYAKAVDGRLGAATPKYAAGGTAQIGPGDNFQTLYTWLSTTFGVKLDNPNILDPGNSQTTGGKHSTTSNHYAGRAVDIGNAKNDRATLNKVAAYAKANPSLFSELYFNPLGWGIKDGKVVQGLTVAGHDDHMHVAVNGTAKAAMKDANGDGLWDAVSGAVGGAAGAVGDAAGAVAGGVAAVASGPASIVSDGIQAAGKVYMKLVMTWVLLMTGAVLVIFGVLKATGTLGTAKTLATKGMA